MKPLVIDLFCGLGGWTKGFLAEGYRAVGFDNHRHVYGKKCYPGQLVLHDVLTLHGSQLKDAAVIVASPPCQKYSYMAMPWTRAKEQAAWYREDPTRQVELNALFNACFRLQREASEAAGRSIPLIVENVKGAQPWVGMAKARFGSFYLWGDVESIGGRIVAGGVRFGGALRAATGARRKNGGGSLFNEAHNTESGTGQNPVNGVKTVGIAKMRDGHTHTRHLTNQRESDALKVPGISFSGYGEPGYKAQGFNVTAAQRYREERGGAKGDGVKQAGSGAAWFDNGICKSSSRSDSRKAASAMIAEIPPDLSQWIAQCFKPVMVNA